MIVFLFFTKVGRKMWMPVPKKHDCLTFNSLKDEKNKSKRVQTGQISS